MKKLFPLIIILLFLILYFQFNSVSGATFAIGDRVKTTANVNVRSCASLGCDPPITTEPKGSYGTIQQGPISADGYIWWKVQYSDGYFGWSAESLLEKVPNLPAGIDVSHHQGAVNWTKVYKAGYVFALVKAIEGTSIDPNFDANIANAKNAGVITGPYHFARPDLNTAIAEADYFLSKAENYIKPGYLRPALDIECDPIPRCSDLPDKATLTKWVQDWMNRVKSRTGVEPIIYTGSSFSRTYLDSSVNTYDLWIANWRCNPFLSPDTGIWSSWDFRQYYEPVNCGVNSVPGITGDVDLDLFNGDISRLNNEFVIGSSSTLSASFSVTPQSGPAPLDTTFTASASGTATGAVNYTFWWDCNESTNSPALAGLLCGSPWLPQNGAKFDGVSFCPVVSHTYLNNGNYTAKVIVERGAAPPAEARIAIAVGLPMCRPASGPGTQEECAVCLSNSDCGQDDWTGNTFCQGNDVYQTWRTNICNNAGQTNASCAYVDAPKLKQSCPTGTTCSGGQCIVQQSCQNTSTSCGVYPNCSDCGQQNGCYGNSYRNYYACSSNSCVSQSDDCSDCSCSCSGYNKEESAANSNCNDGKDNDCDSKTDSADIGCVSGVEWKQPSANGSLFNEFINPQNAYALDSAYASYSCDGYATHYHDYYNFNFNVPEGNAVTQIDLKAIQPTANGQSSYQIMQISRDRGATFLYSGGGSVYFEGQNKIGTDIFNNYGAGLNWPPGDVSNSNFRVKVFLFCGGPTTVCNLDAIQAKVYYAPAPPQCVSGVCCDTTQYRFKPERTPCGSNSVCDNSGTCWPLADTDRNSLVNLLDLIFIRGRLNGDVSASDNWRADVNQDGKINILDLIEARNRMGGAAGDEETILGEQ